MTRDFLVEFEDAHQALAAQSILASVGVDDGAPLFGEIDNRGNSLFVSLTYPHEITAKTQYQFGERKLSLFSEVSFVAIKNGMHQGEGFAFFSPRIAPFAPPENAHVALLGTAIKNYFGLDSKAQLGTRDTG
jgi:hypothetical protein